MDALQFYFFAALAGIFCLFFLVKGLRGLTQGRFTTTTGTAGTWSFLNYFWARRRLREEGEPFYETKTGTAARICSITYLVLGILFGIGILVLGFVHFS